MRRTSSTSASFIGGVPHCCPHPSHAAHGPLPSPASQERELSPLPCEAGDSPASQERELSPLPCEAGEG
ncbi:hypothetical protein D9623_29465 [Azospirillum brasilense]|nr:hypothetical protein D9623_29465 [Azospirillum brasilense]